MNQLTINPIGEKLANAFFPRTQDGRLPRFPRITFQQFVQTFVVFRE